MAAELFAFPAPETRTQFEKLWQLWPNKAKKPLARAKFEAIVAGGNFKTRTLDKDSGNYVDIEISGSADEILAGAKLFLDKQIDRNTFKMIDGGRFIPHLATFLNQGRWTDFT